MSPLVPVPSLQHEWNSSHLESLNPKLFSVQVRIRVESLEAVFGKYTYNILMFHLLLRGPVCPAYARSLSFRWPISTDTWLIGAHRIIEQFFFPNPSSPWFQLKLLMLSTSAKNGHLWLPRLFKVRISHFHTWGKFGLCELPSNTQDFCGKNQE